MEVAVASCLIVLSAFLAYCKGYKKGQEDAAKANQNCYEKMVIAPSRPIRGNAKIGSNY